MPLYNSIVFIEKEKEEINHLLSWLGHRINGNIINGKPARFSPSELATLKQVLEDISIKMRETSAKIALV